MNDFQEQAKNWLRNVVKQNPDKIKAGVEKAGDLIDKQTGGKYADKVDSVQRKVGDFVDKQDSDGTAGSAASTGEASSQPAGTRTDTVPPTGGAAADAAGTEPATERPSAAGPSDSGSPRSTTTG